VSSSLESSSSGDASNSCELKPTAESVAATLGFPAAAAGYWFPDLARMKHDVRILRSFYKTYLAEKEKSNKKELNCLLSTNKK